MLSVQQLLSITLLTSLAAELVPEREAQPCGGRLKGPYGIIQTPNFPNAFPVPIKCKWIISHDLVNGTISIYFTQQYATSGLSFTEYMYYDDTYKLGERRAFQVTEENITRVKWLQVQSPVLVVELSLAALEGTQLRALGLLAVFGLNITYAVSAASPPRARADPAAVSAPAPAVASCSALECRLLGHCYATHDYQQFYCACFEGYSGADCGEGPLCSPNMCKHGGICRQMGPAAVSCICPLGYTGDLCESRNFPPECGIEECSEGCKKGTTCDCNPKDNDATSARYEIRLQVMGQANTNILEGLLNQLTTYLKASNITLEEDLEIINISSPDSTGARWTHVRAWGPRRAAGALRSALARLLASPSRRLRLPLAPAELHIDMQPALNFHALTLNQRSEIWEGSEFILSCTVYGSPEIVFTWYKDGVKINFNGTMRDIWTRTVAEDALGRRISVLGVSEAKQLDSGKWSCAADDAGRRRCGALWLTVLKPPDIRLLPSTLTVNKGNNVSITCLAGASRLHGVLGFSWARERNLLPLAPGREVWEDLYPAGSVLKLYNIQKSGEYRCQVSSVAGTNAKGVSVWVLGVNDEVCKPEVSNGFHWPKTAPGALASTLCPTGYSGETTRFCEPKTSQQGVKWRQTDFSGCIADSLTNIYDQFVRISYGYSRMDIAKIAHQYGSILRFLPSHPGDGTIPLQHTNEMLYYVLSAAGRPKDREESVEYFLRILDTLLVHPDAFLDEKDTYKLQNSIVETAGMKDYLDLHFHEFSIMTIPIHDDNSAHFNLEARHSGDEEWLLVSAGVELLERSGNATAITVQYNHLASRLPSLRTSIEFKNGREIEYLLVSQQLQLSVNGAGVDVSCQHTVTLLFTHINNFSAILSKLACGMRDSSEHQGAWTTSACEVRLPEPKHVACRCRGLGTFALFTVARSTLTGTEKDLRGIVKITAGIGGAFCLAVAVLQLVGLLLSRKAKLPIFLKAITAGTHSAAMLTLLECDTRQEEACAGGWGWMCALCWCAGSAALCAQPLLLQAELAARASSAPATGLLAGVCILIWLTARLWGGTPLQIGSAAQIVFAAGNVLLLILCFALAVFSGLRLRTITHKVHLERRNYIKDKRKVVHHTLILLLTTTAAMVSGIAYAQPGEDKIVHVMVFAVTAIANGIAMLVCYVICDEECMLAAKRALSLMPNKDWADGSPGGDTSLNLYIKQSCEEESSGGVVNSSSPLNSYWRAPNLESPARAQRRQSTPDSRADIIRCVEYAPILSRPVRSRGLYNPIPRCPPTHLDLELVTRPQEHCSLCTRSTPDVSTPVQEASIKSCLKKTGNNQQYTSSISLPSMGFKDEFKPNLDIEKVNRDWNKAYSSTDSDKVLIKISNDLDFLLDRSEAKHATLDLIEKAPT